MTDPTRPFAAPGSPPPGSPPTSPSGSPAGGRPDAPPGVTDAGPAAPFTSAGPYGFTTGSGPTGLAGGVGPWGFGAPVPALKHDATAPTQVIVFVLCALAMGALAHTVGSADVVTFGTAALALGVALSLALDLRRFFRPVPGIVIALAALVVLFFVWGLVEARQPYAATSPNPAPLVLVGVLLVGMDWRWVERLRPLVVCSGLLVVPLLGAQDVVALPLALAWFGLAATAYWSCTRDLMRANPRLQPLTSEVHPVSSSVDLVRIAGGAAAAGLAVILLYALLFPPKPANPSGASGATATGPSVNAPSGGGQRLPGAGGAGGGAGAGGASGGASGGGGEDVSRGAGGDGGSPQNGNLPFDDGSGDGSGGASGGAAGGGAGGGVLDGRSGAGASDPAGNAASGTAGASRAATSWTSLGLLVLGLLVLVVVLALLWPVIKRWLQEPVQAAKRTWADTFARRLEHEGRRRGRPRRRGETIVEYCERLREHELPDPRLPEAGAIASRALFGPDEPSAEARHWADTVLDEVVAATPREKSSRASAARVAQDPARSRAGG